MTKWLPVLAGLVLVLAYVLAIPAATSPGITELLPPPESVAPPGTVTIGATVVGSRPLERVELHLGQRVLQPAVFVRDERTWVVRYQAELPAGSYEVTLTATDERGYERTQTWRFVSSGPLQKPVLLLVEPQPDMRFARGVVPVRVRVQSAGALERVELAIDGRPVDGDLGELPPSEAGAYAHASLVQAEPWLDAGTHRIDVAVTDAYGAEATASWTVTVVAEEAAANARYFPETGFTLAGALKAYWEEKGGDALFGPPVGPLVEREDGTQIQYTRYARLELHPDGSVTLGLLGTEVLGTVEPPVEDPGEPGVRYFPETGHTLRGPFLAFWEQNGGLEVFGLPISEPVVENGYRIQYFERARFEQRLTPDGSAQPVELAPLGELRWRDERATLSLPSS